MYKATSHSVQKEKNRILVYNVALELTLGSKKLKKKNITFEYIWHCHIASFIGARYTTYKSH